MSKILIDKEKIERFLNRGVANIYPNVSELRKKLESGDRLRVYQGFDPTGPYLHVGHAMGVRALRLLQEMGHEVIFLVGDYTAKVGDPDKDATREILTDVEIEHNMEGWKKQVSKLIDFEGENPVLFKRNYEWLSKLTPEDLIKLMSHATVQQMVERDLFQKRIANNNMIQLQEFIYPLMQGYDSVAMNVDIEIGGTDQTFNMLMGRHLVKEYLGKEKFVRTNKMMDAPDSKTMSKTKGNGINLSDTPEIMYGKAMSYNDAHILVGLELLTDTADREIAEIKVAIEKGENPMIYKKLMAKRIVSILHGEKAGMEAESKFNKTVQNKEINQESVSPSKAPDDNTLLEFLKTATEGRYSSGEIKRVIEQGGVVVIKEQGGVVKSRQKVTDFNARVDTSPDTIYKFGKREFFRPVR
ncbi:MAG: tyrosine--tRNA ligase [Patescibacteria group bacterium]